MKKTATKKAGRASSSRKQPDKSERGGRKAAKKAKPKPKAPRQSKTELRVDRFVGEYLIDYNGRQAAIRAGYSPDTARQIASELLAKPEVQANLQERQAKLLDSLGVTTELVMSRLHAIATADPRELTELHRCCCRYCWGHNHLFQVTPREMRELRHNWEMAEAERSAKGLGPVPFDEQGGTGFNPYKDPNPNCPECWGEGEGRAVFKDTRDLSPTARLLFAGVEQTQHGLKIRTHSQPEALVNIGKQLGMFTRKHELTGPGGGPIQQQHALIDEILESLGDADTGPGPARGRRSG